MDRQIINNANEQCLADLVHSRNVADEMSLQEGVSDADQNSAKLKEESDTVPGQDVVAQNVHPHETKPFHSGVNSSGQKEEALQSNLKSRLSCLSIEPLNSCFKIKEEIDTGTIITEKNKSEASSTDLAKAHVNSLKNEFRTAEELYNLEYSEINDIMEATIKVELDEIRFPTEQIENLDPLGQESDLSVTANQNATEYLAQYHTRGNVCLGNHKKKAPAEGNAEPESKPLTRSRARLVDPLTAAKEDNKMKKVKLEKRKKKKKLTKMSISKEAELRKRSAERTRKHRSKRTAEEIENHRLKERIAKMKKRLLAQLLLNEDKLRAETARETHAAKERRLKRREKETPEQAALRKRRQALQSRLNRNRLKAVETPEETATRKAAVRALLSERRRKQRASKIDQDGKKEVSIPLSTIKTV